MSRSRKKTAGWCDRNPYMKNYANRRLRRISVWEDIHDDHKWYRRYSCSWEICDFRVLYWSDNEIRIQEEEWEKKYGWCDMGPPAYKYRMK